MSIEVCVDSLESALAAEAGGADRVELCCCLREGGLTPSHGLLSLVCKSLTTCKVHVLIRPRPGDFIYSLGEVEIMRQDVLHAASCGAHGVALGMVTADGKVALDQLRPFVTLCSALGLDLTFHRAFDIVRDQLVSLEDLIACGVKRVLTSGGRMTVQEGLDQLQALVRQSGGRISIMPGGGVTEENVETIVSVTGVREVHGTFKRSMPSAMQHHNSHMSFLDLGPDSRGGDEWSRLVTDAEAVKIVRQRLGSMVS